MNTPDAVCCFSLRAASRYTTRLFYHV